MHPMDAIRQRLWQLASERPNFGNDLARIDRHLDEAVRRARLWALNVAAEISANFTDLDDRLLIVQDGELVARVVSGLRDILNDAASDLPGNDVLYDLSMDIAAALKKVAAKEIEEDGMPAWASAREALQALQNAVAMPQTQDLRSLALQLSTVPEHAALSAGYHHVEIANEGRDRDYTMYFIERERDPRVGQVIEEKRSELGTRWLADLQRRLETGLGEDFQIAPAPAPSFSP